ncbi:MAG TPA: hypothetical protein VH916_09740 [Dehalococcoidia bacterium]|jgi:hypothetical protein
MTPEIRAFEYALGLFAVLIGLAVADVATSFHRLARGRAPVVWDPLCLAAALFALCMAVGMWFDLWGVRHFAATRHFFFYLSMVAEFFVLFLIAAASLPDEVREGCDLREHYARNRRYFWTLVALFQFSYLLNGLYFVGGMLPRLSLASMLFAVNNLCVPLLIALVLVSVRSRAVHYAGVVLLFVSFAVHYAPYQIN